MTSPQLAPLSTYLFIPKSLLVTLVFKKLIRPILQKGGFWCGNPQPHAQCRHMGGSFTDPPGLYFTQDFFRTSMTCRPQGVPGRLSVSAMFSTCIFVPLANGSAKSFSGFLWFYICRCLCYILSYLPHLEVAFCRLPFFLFLITVLTLLLNFSAFKKPF